MSLFLVTARDQSERVRAAICERYGEEIFQVSPDCWLLVDSTSTREVAVKLGIRDGVLGPSALISKVSAYSGWSEPGLWDWLRARPEALSDG